MIPFAAYTAAETPSTFRWTGQLPLPYGDLDLHVVPWAQKSQTPKRHLDRFTRFTQLDRHTDHATCDICSIYAMHATRPKMHCLMSYVNDVCGKKTAENCHVAFITPFMTNALSFENVGRDTSEKVLPEIK